MSTYRKITKHPQTGVYEVATWIDDYYGSHLYGVEFKSDAKVYPVELVEAKQIYDFWIDDVLEAYKVMQEPLEENELVDFLNQIQAQYTNRWKNDPMTGGGATTKSRVWGKMNDELHS